MLLIENNTTAPYFNLALEEHLFRNFKEDCFMLWRNEDTIVVGKHQNALAEINASFAREHNIAVVRRLSGGGTVFHDLGNINFTFILTRETEKVVDFRRYMTPVYELLKKLEVNVNYSERNDLFIEGKKVSGNAEHAVRNRVLHHGTLLYSSVIGRLSEALKVRPAVYKDNAVKSVRSPVTNIRPFLREPMDIEAFMELVRSHVQSYYPAAVPYRLTAADVEAVNRLVVEKYATWEWNYGYSPRYEFHNSVALNGEQFEINLGIKKGIVETVDINAALLGEREKEAVVSAILGLPHRSDIIMEKLAKVSAEGLISATTRDALLKTLL